MNAVARPGRHIIEKLLETIKEGCARGIFPMLDYEPEHIFADGLYGRKANAIPAGTVIISKVHKQQHITVPIKGVVTIYDQDGNRQTIHPGEVFITEPGTQRAIYCHDEVEWLTIHAVKSHVLEEIEKVIFCDSFTEFDALIEDMRVAA